MVAQRHLDDEEQKVVPLAAVTVTQQEWWDALGKHAVAQIPWNKRYIAFGMMLEPLSEADRAHMMGVLPAPCGHQAGRLRKINRSLTDAARVELASRPSERHRPGAIAQLEEHLLCKQGVRGSSPLSSTRRFFRRVGPVLGPDHHF